MIDLSNLRAPGWNRVVAELATPAGDDRAYLERLLRVIGQVSASKQACLVLPQAGDAGAVVARVIAAWPSKSQTGAGAANGAAVDNGATIVVEHEREVKQAAIGVFESSQSRAFALDEQSGVYDGSGAGGSGYLLAVPVPDGGGRAAAAITLLIDSRSRAAVQSTLAMAEVLAGYVHGHTARSELKRQQASVMALELATRLLSAVNSQTTFKGAALQLVNDLTRQLGADRAALGWVKGNSIEVVALSDAEDFNKRTEMVRKLAGAMDECLDQEQAVVFPVPETGQDVLLAHAIVAAHRELAAGTPGLVVCSVPLRRARRLPGETSTTDETIGVITVELRAPAAQPGQGAAKQAIDTRGVEVLQSAADLLGPVLATRWSDDRVLPLRAVDATKRTASWLVGPTHTAWKVAGVLIIAAFIFCALFKIEHRVGSNATLEATGRRVIAAPFDGVVASLGPGVKPGAKVKAGEVLAELDTRELKLQMSSAMARREQGERQLANARKEGKAAEAQMAQAAVDRALADANLLARRIELSKLTAPTDGVILAGDLQDKIGAAVKVGDSLMQIAPLSDLYVLARVDERDVGLIKTGGAGQIRLKAEPGEGYPITIEAIVPLAVAKDGKNEFEVRGKLAEVPEWMRPGMEGIARLDAGRRSLLWIGTRRVIDTIRLWVW